MLVAIILVLFIAVMIFLHIRTKIKRLNLPNVVLITGAPKTGKTGLAVSMAFKAYRKNVFKWFITYPLHLLKKLILKLFKKKYEMPLKPIFVTNIKVRGVPFTMLTKDVIFRRVRLPLNSVVLIDEASFLADSLMIHSIVFNNVIKRFFKLFGHAYGNDAQCFYTTHTLSDLHFNWKRCTGTYLYIGRKMKFPFVTLLKVREMLCVDDMSINTSNEDFETSLKTCWFFNSNYKRYDSRCFSLETDTKPLINIQNIKLTRRDSLKMENILSLESDYQEMLNKENLEKRGKKYEKQEIQ